MHTLRALVAFVKVAWLEQEIRRSPVIKALLRLGYIEVRNARQTSRSFADPWEVEIVAKKVPGKEQEIADRLDRWLDLFRGSDNLDLTSWDVTRIPGGFKITVYPYEDTYDNPVQ